MTWVAIVDSGNERCFATRPPTAAPEVAVQVSFDEQEIQRRTKERFGSLLGLQLLNVLALLPFGSPVKASRFSEYELSMLRRAQRKGAAEFTHRNGQQVVIRHAAPPLMVHHATITCSNWRKGLSIASRFAPYCSREIALMEMPTDDLELRLEADYLGIGVTLRPGSLVGQGVRIIEPASFAPARYTGASWLFAEKLLLQRGNVDYW